MGRVTTEATIESMRDLYAAQAGILTPAKVRRVTVPDAVVDTGATILSMPIHLIEELGLERVGLKRVRSTTGLCEVGLYDAVRLTVLGRTCTTDVLELPDGSPVLVGQLPLEALDFVVNLRGRRLIGNPEHGGEQMYELFWG